MADDSLPQGRRAALERHEVDLDADDLARARQRAEVPLGRNPAGCEVDVGTGVEGTPDQGAEQPDFVCAELLDQDARCAGGPFTPAACRTLETLGARR